MLGNFNNVSMGTGILQYDGVSVGFLKGDVQYDYNYDIEYFKTGVPLILRGVQAKEIISSLKAPIAELSAENLAMALGGLPITTTSSAQTVSAGSAGPPDTRELVTFSSTFGGYGLDAVALRGPNVTSLTVKSSDDVTTYVAGTDYLLLPLVGHILRLAGGGIGSGDTVHVAYTWDPGSLKTLNLGLQFSLAQKQVIFTHTRPNTQKTVKVTIPKAQLSGKASFKFAETAWIINEVEFNAIYDETTPAYPLGKVEIQQ